MKHVLEHTISGKVFFFAHLFPIALIVCVLNRRLSTKFVVGSRRRCCFIIVAADVVIKLKGTQKRF